MQICCLLYPIYLNSSSQPHSTPLPLYSCLSRLPVTGSFEILTPVGDLHNPFCQAKQNSEWNSGVQARSVWKKNTSKFTALAAPWQTPSIRSLNLKATNLQVLDGEFSSLDKFVSNSAKTNWPFKFKSNHSFLRKHLTSLLLTLQGRNYCSFSLTLCFHNPWSSVKSFRYYLISSFYHTVF